MNTAILVLGYNNTRINDVKKIREKARTCIGALTVLCKKNPTDTDSKAADLVIDVSLNPSSDNIEHITSTCIKNNIQIIGVLPFSDQGTQLGASLAKHLDLPGADPSKIEAALNKHIFREKEQSNVPPKGYQPVNAIKVTSLNDLHTAFKNSENGIFLKPMAEGNSRGCIAIKNYSDCAIAWDEVQPYVDDGITAECLIQNAQEYSWEHVAGYSWITEKMTTKSQYRAEPQHILPAPILKETADLLTNGTRFMAEICGYNGCACHNEIFLSETKNHVMAVEPNLRPAGGKLWDLSVHAFEDFDPWINWILWATGKLDHTPKILKQKAFAGMRFITAKKTGFLKEININSLVQLSEKISGDFIELTWTKTTGNHVTENLRDNSDFLGYITARADNYNKLSEILIASETILADACIIT